MSRGYRAHPLNEKYKITKEKMTDLLLENNLEWPDCKVAIEDRELELDFLRPFYTHLNNPRAYLRLIYAPDKITGEGYPEVEVLYHTQDTPQFSFSPLFNGSGCFIM